eukprot:TRINITY_DN23021_c0_g1_i1.p2 TRINITY_DN23021_c0_g1~~TRINITY_DN23021_c0_g1_i1.p2  ORF type:complete len:431 (+),score=106.54 TRINITY_DN23021_c0_g1_i1:86-1378(+)
MVLRAGAAAAGIGSLGRCVGSAGGRVWSAAMCCACPSAAGQGQRRTVTSPAPRETAAGPWDRREVDRLVDHYSRLSQEPLSVEDQLRVGREARMPNGRGIAALVEDARHVQRALPARLARAVQQTRLLPPEVAAHDGVAAVATKCADGVVQLARFEEEHGLVQDEAGQQHFALLLGCLTERMRSTAEEFLRLRSSVGQARALPAIDPSFFDAFLARLLRGSVSWTLPVMHHLNLRNNRGERHVGAFDTLLRPSLVAAECAFRVEGIARKELGKTPRIIVKGDDSATVEFVEAHLVYILTELLKNCAHATVGHHGDSEGELPAVEVVVHSTAEGVVLTVSDRGGGIAKRGEGTVFRYGVSSKAGCRVSGLSGCAAPGGSALAGWGCGLPRSKVYAQYLGGDLVLAENHPGAGCTMQLTLPRAASERCAEHL